MVNNINISRYNGSMPASMDDNRAIPGGPLYQPEEVLALLGEKGFESLIPWTRKCKDDLQKYSIDTEDAMALVCRCLRIGQFLGSEWCKQNPSGPWAACDAYRVFVRQWVNAAHKDMNFEYYIKFAIGKTGLILLLVSCHLSENR
jgi:hypothetical protein